MKCALKRNADGSYTAENGWQIRKNCDSGLWTLINGETGRVFDSHESLAVLRRTYGTPIAQPKKK